MTLQKNDVIQVKITDFSESGEGVGKADGFPVFIKDAVIGDTVEATVTKVKKSYAYGHLNKIELPSEHRIEPFCKEARQCGGCSLQALSYEEQLRYKESKVKNNLIRIGRFDRDFIDKICEPIIGMDNPIRYRNKAQFPIGTDKDGNIISGFYAGHSHRIVQIDDCQIGAVENEQILKIISAWMERNKISAYDENTQSGLVRHVVIKKGFFTGDILVCPVLNLGGKRESDRFSKEKSKFYKRLNTNISGADSFKGESGEEKLVRLKPALAALAKELSSAVKGIKSISVNINNSATNVIMGDETRLIWGDDTIEDMLCGLKFKISARSFYQVNPIQTEKLYKTAVEYASLSGEETVWDLYCGIGTISLSMAKRAKRVYGIEEVPQAIEDARVNARLNGMNNAVFYAGRTEEILPKLYDQDKADVIVVDPPRKGCAKEALDTMLKMSPCRIVYVSCDPATLARDLRILADGGYELKRIRPVDMFPWSGHVEAIVLLSKLDSKNHISVELPIDDMDLTSAESKATYKEIQNYVLEKFGFKVSTLYIAQAKRKFGLEVNGRYNISKNENQKVIQCPIEKEEAILDALKYFKMLEC